MNWNWSLFWLLLHIAAAIIGIGPGVAAFAMIGAYSERNPGHLTFTAGVIEFIASRLVIPVAATMLISGLALVYTLKINLFETPWLLIGLILYLGVMGAATGHQLPTTRRVIALSRESGGGPPPAEVLALLARVKMVGIAMSLSVLVIIFLMVVKPGTTTFSA